MTFRVGQKVVCISENAKWPSWTPDFSFPKCGQIYTVRDIGNGYDGSDDICIRVQEIVNDRTYCGEPNFMAARFRPIVEKKTDISIFTELLKPKQYSKELCDND